MDNQISIFWWTMKNILSEHQLILSIYECNDVFMTCVHKFSYLHDELHILALLGEGATSDHVDHVVIGKIRVVPPHDKVVRCGEVGVLAADNVDRCISKAIHTTISM